LETGAAPIAVMMRFLIPISEHPCTGDRPGGAYQAEYREVVQVHHQLVPKTKPATPISQGGRGGDNP
jgi:hypothetical protein